MSAVLKPMKTRPTPSMFCLRPHQCHDPLPLGPCGCVHISHSVVALVRILFLLHHSRASTVRVVYFTLFWYPVGYVYLASVYVSDQCPGSFWAYNIVCQDPCDASSNRLHVDILQFCFLHLRYTVFSHYLDTSRVWVFGAGDSWHSLKIIHPRYRGWSGSNKKRPPMGLRADSFECDVTRLIRGLWLYFWNQIAQK